MCIDASLIVLMIMAFSAWISGSISHCPLECLALHDARAVANGALGYQVHLLQSIGLQVLSDDTKSIAQPASIGKKFIAQHHNTHDAGLRVGHNNNSLPVSPTVRWAADY